MVRALRPDDELERRTTQCLVGRLEWMVALWQAAICTITASVDTYRAEWVNTALVVLAVAHVHSVPVSLNGELGVLPR